MSRVQRRRVLVIGQGGREHAIVLQLLRGRDAPEVFVWPGSDGMLQVPAGAASGENAAAQRLVAETQAGEVLAPGALVDAVLAQRIELVIIGPEQPLADGVADLLRARNISVFGPSQEGARLESSKIHAKEIMQAAGVQTARSFVVDSVASCLAAASEFKPPYVLKADGLAAGKGVFIEKTLSGLEQAARALFEKRILGEAGARALLEEFSPGYEVSHLVLTNGKSAVALPPARDHKRLGEGDQGPNTGGMGVVAPVSLPSGLLEKIERDVVAPVVRELERRKILFRGVLYFGLMITDRGPSVLEFNTRFGDPEAQALLPLLDEMNGPTWTEAFSAIAKGEIPELVWHERRHVACVVLAAQGYPEQPLKGVAIPLLQTFRPSPTSYILHAGTSLHARIDDSDGEYVTSGGRVLNAVGLSEHSLEEALRQAYLAAEAVRWPGCQMRRDIGMTS